MSTIKGVGLRTFARSDKEVAPESTDDPDEEMNTTCSLAKLEAARDKRPPGYVDALLAAGVVVGGVLVIDSERVRDICRQYGVETPLPSLLQQARNASNAAGRVAGAVVSGRPVVASAEEQDRRAAICQACEEWTGTRCRVCGCGKVKLWLITEHCPLPVRKW